MSLLEAQLDAVGELVVVFTPLPVPEQSEIKVMMRKGQTTVVDRFSWQLEWAMRPLSALGFTVFGANPSLFFQYWNGYGEGLLDYNVRTERFRAGFAF